MRTLMRRWMARVAALACIFAWGAMAALPERVILLVGDGMGPEHIKAAGLFANGQEGSLFMETLPGKALVRTCSYYTIAPGQDAGAVPPKVTDSAAAATAMAAGRKVYNGVLSVALPGDGQPLQTVMEQFAAAGKRTGLVTTSYLTDATPAAFGAHVKLRSMAGEIFQDYLKRSRPNVLFGGNNRAREAPLTPEKGKAAGYVVVLDRPGLQSLSGAAADRFLGLFGAGPMCYEYDFAQKSRKDYDTLPHLSEMAAAALDILSREPKGFFVMIEGACIDKASHANHLPRAVYETVEFDKTVKLAVEWAARHEGTLVLVVGDHETGGLKVVSGQGRGRMPEVAWVGKDHSNADVRLFATGPGSERVSGTLDNTDVYRLMTGTFTGPTRFTPPISAGPAAGLAPAGKD